MKTTKNHSYQYQHIAIFLRALGHGGVGRTMLNLAAGLAQKGHKIDLVLGRCQGRYLEDIPSGIEVFDLSVRSPYQALKTLPYIPKYSGALIKILFTQIPHWILGAIPGLSRYLVRNSPDVLISALGYPNLVAILAREAAQVDTSIIVTTRTNLSLEIKNAPRRRIRAKAEVARRFYPLAEAVVAVSNGVADDLAEIAELPRDNITTIYNPTVTPDLLAKAKHPVGHAWFQSGEPPVILAAGRFKPQKDFFTLIRAFTQVQKAMPARLMIVGEGKLRPQLETLIRQTGITSKVDLPGFVDNPYSYMSKASVFVLSSTWEGLPNVLIEALSCGSPVVSTNCPSGTAEILDNGQYGPLVPVGDEDALAQAMIDCLNSPIPEENLIQRGQEFSVERACDQYLKLIENIQNKN